MATNCQPSDKYLSRSLQLKNLYKMTRIMDRNFEKILTTYLEDLHGHASLMPDVERRKYVSERIASLNSIIRKFGYA